MEVISKLLDSGEHETQESEGGEDDLSKHFTNCRKNPGHIEFIPVEAFSLKHLPADQCDKDLYELIKATAELTVKVSVNMTSLYRPEFWPNQFVPYPFYNKRGHRNLRTGSGRVDEVTRVNGHSRYLLGGKPQESATCRCKKCQLSDTPCNTWWKFRVITAAHVVCDETEAIHTSFRLFYDKANSPEVILNPVSVDQINIEEDRCTLNCVTCDKSIGRKLNKVWNKWCKLWLNIDNKFRRLKDIHKLSFIVSHPHGCPKMISIGQWMDKLPVLTSSHLTKFTYKTCTCPGSSGAQVYFIGYIGGCDEHVHSGTTEGINFSGLGLVD